MGDNWVECYIGDGSVYYWNKVTNETVWALPDQAQEEEDEYTEKYSKNYNRYSTYQKPAKRSAPPPAPPPMMMMMNGSSSSKRGMNPMPKAVPQAPALKLPMPSRPTPVPPPKPTKEDISEEIEEDEMAYINSYASEKMDERTGYLTRLAGKSWKRQWIVVRGDRLYYFNEKDEPRPQGEIDLNGATVEEDKVTQRPNAIHVYAERKHFSFAADSPDEMIQWIDIMNAAAMGEPFPESTSAPIARSAPQSTYTSENNMRRPAAKTLSDVRKAPQPSRVAMPGMQSSSNSNKSFATPPPPPPMSRNGSAARDQNSGNSSSNSSNSNSSNSMNSNSSGMSKRSNIPPPPTRRSPEMQMPQPVKSKMSGMSSMDNNSSVGSYPPPSRTPVSRSAVNSQQSFMAPKPAPPRDPNALPQNWEELYTEDGYVYYRNILTDERQWERPEQQQGSRRAPPTNPAQYFRPNLQKKMENSHGSISLPFMATGGEKKDYLYFLAGSMNWITCWFVLKGSTLSYYYDPEDTSQPVGQLPLRGAFVERDRKSSRPYAFRIRTMTNENFQLAADSDETAEEWVVAIKFSVVSDAAPKKEQSEEEKKRSQQRREREKKEKEAEEAYIKSKRPGAETMRKFREDVEQRSVDPVYCDCVFRTVEVKEVSGKLQLIIEVSFDLQKWRVHRFEKQVTELLSSYPDIKKKFPKKPKLLDESAVLAYKVGIDLCLNLLAEERPTLIPNIKTGPMFLRFVAPIQLGDEKEPDFTLPFKLDLL